MDWTQFRLDSVRTAVFTPDVSAFAPSQAVATIFEASSIVFDGPMMVLPLDSEAPPQIPRVELKTADESRRVTISPSRIDSYWTHKGALQPPSVESVAKECSELQARYIKRSNLHVDRVALVVGRVLPADDPARDLVRHFCNEESIEGPFRRSATFEVHNHKKYSLTNGELGFEVNSWVRCRCAKLVADNSSVIFIEQDLNTIPNGNVRAYSLDAIAEFFDVAAKEMNSILSLYFPERQ